MELEANDSFSNEEAGLYESKSSDNEKELQKIEDLQKEKAEFMQEIKQKIKQPEDLPKDNQESLTSRMKFLLNQADIFAHFLLSRNEKHKNQKKTRVTSSKRRAFLNEKDEDPDLLEAENKALEHVEDLPTRLNLQPSILKGGHLKEFQIIGLNWLISLYENGINGILADEMGLGKTIQTIALLGFLKEFKKIHGPHLIIAPKSTLGNWYKEIRKWLPCARVVKLIATKDEREDILKKELKHDKFDICLTSYQGINICLSSLSKFKWKYMVIDEAHKIKNEESLLSTNIRKLATNFKLLLTGTPLQNNLHELWSLLNFLLPDIFESSEVFDSWFNTSSNEKLKETISEEELENRHLETIKQLHRIIKPFMLRRTKAEVDRTIPPKKELHLYIGLTEMQVKIYKNMLRNHNALDTDSKNFYLNILMQLRKVCNHPYLFEGVEEENQPCPDDHLVSTSGKMIVLDKLLLKLSKESHKVLIFSQMTRMLDILEDYCNFRSFPYCRIDGDTDIVARDTQIADFCDPKSEKFVFLLSTRAGGLGINLASADTVVLYDSDWNPQMDLQAIDRAHRIGQQNPVNVYRLVCEDTVEEKIIERQRVKLSWDNLVIQQGRLTQKNKVFTKEQLKEMVQYGANNIFRVNGGTYTDEDINIMLQRGEEKAKLQQEEIDKSLKKNKNFLDLAFTSVDLYEFQNENYALKKKEDEIALKEAFFRDSRDFFARTRREKKSINSTLDLNVLEREMLNNGGKLLPGAVVNKVKTIKLPEHYLFPQRERLTELLTRENEFKNRQKQPKTMSSAGVVEEEAVVGLSPEEIEEKERLLKAGFQNWTKVEFLSFIQGCERYGRNEFEKIKNHMTSSKSLEEIKNYSKAFWERVMELSEGSKLVKTIEKGEKNIESRAQAEKLFKEKCEGFKNAREELVFTTNYYSKFRDKFFTFAHDKYLVWSSNEYGFENGEKVKEAIKTDGYFKFDHFFRSRSSQDLVKRTKKLLKVLEREKEENKEKAQKALENKENTISSTTNGANIQALVKKPIKRSSKPSNPNMVKQDSTDNSKANIQKQEKTGANEVINIDSSDSSGKKKGKILKEPGLKQISLDNFMIKTNSESKKRPMGKDLIVDLEKESPQSNKKQKVEDENKQEKPVINIIEEEN